MAARIWAKRDQNWAQNYFFCHFLKFGSLVLPVITYNDSLQQCLTSSRNKIHTQKNWTPNLGQSGQNRARNYVFLSFFQVWLINFPWNCINDSLQQCTASSRGKTNEKIGGSNLGQTGQNWVLKKIFCHFFKFGLLVFH